MAVPDIQIDNTKLGQVLVLSLSGSDQLVHYQLERLIRHRPDYLLPCQLRFRNSQPQLCLDITSQTPLDQAFSENELNSENGRRIMIRLLEILLAADDQLLPLNQFSLRPDMIFIQPDKPDYPISLAFWPVKLSDPARERQTVENWHQLDELIGSLGKAFSITSQEISQYEASLHHGGLKGLFNYLAAPVSVPPDNRVESTAKRIGRNMIRARILQCIQSIRIPTAVLILLHIVCLTGICLLPRQNTSWSNNGRVLVLLLLLILLTLDFCQFKQSCVPGRPVNYSRNKLKADQARSTDKSSPIEQLGAVCSWFKRCFTGWMSHLSSDSGVGETDNGGQTVLLSSNPVDFRMALLAEGKPGTPEENEGIRAYILVDEFIIGRDQKLCDLFLADPGIGRQHARIVRREGAFFISDLGSRNGTSLDGRRLMKNAESLLPDQCLIKFADRQFHFRAD